MQPALAQLPKALKRPVCPLELVFLGAALIVIVNTGILYAVGNRTLDSNVRQKSMLQAVTDLEQLLSAIKDAESAQRGFLLTGDESYLELFDAAPGQIAEELAGVKRHWIAEPESVHAIKELIDKRMEQLRSVAELRRAHGLDPATEAVGAGDGARIMNVLRSQVNELKETEEGKLRREMEQQDKLTQVRTTLFMVLASGNIVFLGWAYSRISKAVEDVEAAAAMRHEGGTTDDPAWIIGG